MRPQYFAAILDACILAPMPVADTLLRLAEYDPPFYAPKWSRHILEETKSVLAKFGYSAVQAEHRIFEMERMFPEALVTGYDGLINAMGNDPKDRHVLAAAVRARADCIVSDNTRHFPASVLEPLEIQCLTAEDFLVQQYHLDPDSFIGVLSDQAREIQRSLADLVASLSKHVPKLASLIKA
jgi:predicted nucleic acid-binding protein